MKADNLKEKALKEVEVKFLIPDKKTAGLYKNPKFWDEFCPGSRETLYYRSYYFDFIGKELSKREFSLRLRYEGKREVLTMKWPSDFENERGELNIDLGERGQSIAELVDDSKNFRPLLSEAGQLIKKDIPSYSMLLDEMMEKNEFPLLRFSAEFERLSVDMRFCDLGEKLFFTFSLDEGKLFAGKKSEDILEMEFEYRCGSPRIFEKLACKVEKMTGLTTSNATKLKRLIMLENSEKTDEAGMNGSNNERGK